MYMGFGVFKKKFLLLALKEHIWNQMPSPIQAQITMNWMENHNQLLIQTQKGYQN